MKPTLKLRYYYHRHQYWIDATLCILTGIILIAGMYLCAYYGAEIDAFFIINK